MKDQTRVTKHSL